MVEDTLGALANGEDEGSKWLKAFIASKNPSDRDFRKARIIASALSTRVRAHAAITGRERAKFSLAKVIGGGDPELTQKYLEAADPKAR